MRSKKKWMIVAGLLGVAAAAGDSIGLNSVKEFYSANTKAFYLADPTVQFVRPGLAITIQSASVASDGTISTTFKIADPQGLPLDLAGVTTPGVVTLSFVAAYIPSGQEQYVAYTTRVATGA